MTEKEEIPAICFYHNNCSDGYFSACVVKKKRPDAIFMPLNYGDEIVDVDGLDVYIVDFSFPLEMMHEIADKANRVVWCDHHQSALDKVMKDQSLLDKIEYNFSTNQCGATLTWEMLYPNEKMPKILEYVRDRDLWHWLLKKSREINEGLDKTIEFSKPEAIDSDNLFPDYAELYKVGNESWQSKIEVIKQLVEGHAKIVDFEGYKAAVVDMDKKENFEVIRSSDICEYMNKTMKCDLAISYYKLRGNDYKYCSLRSKTPKVNVAAIAEKYDGGGHKKAAGFRTKDISIFD